MELYPELPPGMLRLPLAQVACIPHARGGPFGGLYLFSTPARLMRPVLQVDGGGLELIGSLEQVRGARGWRRRRK